MNRDPIAEKGGLNVYGFVNNNSISGIDRTGLAGATLPPLNPKIPTWPTTINPEIEEKHKWHHTRQEISVYFCKCTDQQAKKIVSDALSSFSQFNNSVEGAEVSLNGSTAGFNMGGFMGGLSDLINSDWAGVTLYGKGVGYDQQAVTNGFHPLIGMRRWGHRGPFKSEPPPGWKKMLIWTEAYETTNNLNWLGARFGWDAAITMWNQYLIGVADLVISQCGGKRGEPGLTTENTTSKQNHPWYEK